MTSLPEAWLRGPLPGIDPFLMPAAHALVQASEDLERAARGLTAAQLWARPGGAAAPGFHLRHIAGVIDRLFTYARGEALNEAQRAALAAESVPGDSPPDADTLIDRAQSAITTALDVFRDTPREKLLEPRAVGRKQLPSTVLGLYSHAAEHAMRHTGQLITTAKIVRAST
ncbi:MAG TPA: DinB family protein [Gemmatimonadaceae bacterium]|nr:DinB family protein [Gemmatimonadaceae bacterium]